MAGGVRVVQPAFLGADTTPEIDTVRVTVEGEERDRQRIAVADRTPVTSWGEALAVAPGATVVVSTLVNSTGVRLLGLTATGNGDGRFRLRIGTQVVLSGHINVTNPTLELTLPVGLPLGTQNATVEVLGQGISPSDYEVTIYGEVSDG